MTSWRTYKVDAFHKRHIWDKIIFSEVISIVPNPNEGSLDIPELADSIIWMQQKIGAGDSLYPAKMQRNKHVIIGSFVFSKRSWKYEV